MSKVIQKQSAEASARQTTEKHRRRAFVINGAADRRIVRSASRSMAYLTKKVAAAPVGIIVLQGMLNSAARAAGFRSWGDFERSCKRLNS